MASLIDTEAGRKRLQQALMDSGFDVGPDGADGDLGGDTAKAIINARVAYKLSRQDQAVVDTDLERELGLLAIQDPLVVGAAGAKGIDILSILKAIAFFRNLQKGTFTLDQTKPWYTSQTVWASGLAIVGTVLTFFHVDFGAAAQAATVQAVIEIATGVSALWAMISRFRATHKLG